ncbi:MAG: ExbD/TolR family protein [Planctomycetota bacterium]|jgi:biopolymer transport protein ExbD
MSVVYRRGRAAFEANLTPMIDVTFLLIVFFVLVSQIVEVESVPLKLPEPVEPRSERIGDEQRVVINVMPGPGGEAAGYRLGRRDFDAGPIGLARLTEALADLYARNPTVNINLRADQDTEYAWVGPAMQAVADAAVRAPGGPYDARLNVVVVRED